MKRAIRVFLLAALCLMLCLSASAEQTERQYVTLGQTDLTVTAEGTTSVYFRAPEAGMYAFYTSSTKDPIGTLYTEDETGTLTQLAHDDDSGFNNNFQVEYELAENQVVRLDTRYLSESEETLPLTVVRMQTVASDAALTLGETELDLSEHTYVKYPFEPGEQSGYYSFTMSTFDATVALYDQSGACICAATNGISPFFLNGGERYTLRVGLRAHMAAQKVSLNINRYDGALEPIANVYINGVRVEESMTVPAYQALTVTFDEVDNAQYYDVYVDGNTWRVEPGQSVVVSCAPGVSGFQIEAKADNWVTSSVYYNVQAEETEAQPELTLSVDSAVNSENDQVTFTLVQTDAPATLWGANGDWSGKLQNMLLLDGAYVLKHREYSGTYQVWATDALGRTSNRVEVTWNSPEQSEHPVYDSLTQLTLNGEPLVSGASVTAGVPIEISCNLVKNARDYTLQIGRNGQMQGRSIAPNGSKPRFGDLSLTEGVWQLYISTYDSNGIELCSSEIYEINAVTAAPSPSLSLSVDRTQAYVDESVMLTSTSDTRVYCWAVNKTNGDLPSYVGMLEGGSSTLSADTFNGGYACQMEYYISDDYGRVSAPVTVDFLYHGTLQPPTVSIGDTVLTQEVFMDLTAGQEYTLTVAEQENATRYQVQVTYVLQSGMETTVTYEGTSNTFTMPDDVRTMRVNAQTLAQGWETGDTGELLVRVGTEADSFVSVLVNGEQWQENMTVRSLEETSISWNYVRNATQYMVDFAFNEMLGGNSSHNVGEAMLTTRFGLSADYVYFRVNAYDADNTLLCSTPSMRLSIDHTLPEASFTLTADRDSAYIGEPIQFTMERPAQLFYATASDRLVYQIGGSTTSITQSWGTVGDVTCFAIDDAGNYSNIVMVHYDTKGTLPEPQLYVNDQPFDGNMIFEPGKTYTLRAACAADGLTDPVSYRFSLEYYDGNGQFISRDESDEAEITTSVPATVGICNMIISCSAPGWQPYSRGFNLPCGVASSTFDSVLVNGEPYVEGMTVAPFDEVRISWNYIVGAEHFNIRISDPQGHTSGYWNHYTSPYKEIMIDDQREWIDLDIEAAAENGASLCSSTLRLQVGDAAPESAFTLTSNAQEIYIGESVHFSADRPFDLYQAAPSDPVMHNVFGQTTVASCTIDQVGTYTFVAADSEGNRSNSVTVMGKSKGKLPAPSLYLGDELLDANTPTFLTPGETYTLRIECSVDGETNPINYYGSLQFFNAENAFISNINVQSETTFTVPEDAVRCSGNFYARANGWEESAAFRSFECGVASSTFDSVLVNGEQWRENMTVRSLEETLISWNYITNATYYGVDFAFNEMQEVNNGYSTSEAVCTTRFGLSADYVYFRVNAYDAQGGTLLSSTPFMRLSIDHTLPEASFTLTADRDSAYLGEPIQFTMERPAQLFYATANDRLFYWIGGSTTSFTQSWSTVGDVTCFAIDDAGNYSNIVTVHYDAKGTLPEPQLYVNDQPYDRNMIFEPGKTYTLRAACAADGLTDPVSYRFSISYYDGNGQFISRDEIDEAEITTSVPAAASRCDVSIFCSAPGWQEYNIGFNLPCGVASTTFDSVLVNGEPYVEGMTVAPFEAVRISWNYIVDAANFNVRISDPQGQTTRYGYHYTNPYADIMIDDQREWIDVDIEAVAEDGSSLCRSALRLQVGGVAPEPAFTLTSTAQEIYTNESVRFSADRLFDLYQAVPSEPVMRKVFGQTAVSDLTIGQAGTYTFVAADSEGNRSNSVTVTAKAKGKLPTPSLYLGDELLDIKTPVFLTPGKTYTLRIECSADGLTDPVNRYGYLHFYNAENVNITSLNLQSETTFTVPEDAVRSSGSFFARAPGWEESGTYCSFICGVASDRFDSVTINGQPYVEGMTVAPYEDIRVSWNYIIGTGYYSVTWMSGNGCYSEGSYGNRQNGMNCVFNASSSQITGTLRAIDGNGAALCTQTLRLNISNVPAPSFQLSADVEETYLDSEVSLTWDREAILYDIAPDQVFAHTNHNAYATSSQYTLNELGTYSFIARDKDGNFSNVVTVECKSRGKLKVPALFFDGTKLAYGWNKDNPILTPGKTYEVTYAFTDAQPEGTYVDLELYYYDDAGEYIGEDYFELDPQPASITVPENAASVEMTVYVSAPGWEGGYAELEVQCGQVSSQLTNLRINGEALSGSATVPSYQPVRISFDYVTGAKKYVLYSPDNDSLRFDTKSSGLSFIPFVNGTYAFRLDALDENQEVISGETFTLTFTQSAPTFTVTADRDRAPVEERIQFTSPVEGTWYFARVGLDAADEYRQHGRGQTEAFEDGYAGIWNAWCVTDDGHRSDVLTFEIYSYGTLADPQLLINGAKPEEARILPGDQVRFTLPAVEHADGYELHISAPGYFRLYAGLEEINAVTFAAPDVNCLSVFIEVYGDGYERNYISWEIPLIQSGLSGLKVNGVAPEQAVITPYVRTQVSLDAIPGAAVYSVQTAHSYSETDSQPIFDVVMLPGEQWLRVQASDGDQYDASRTVLAWDTVAVKVSDAVPAPAFQLDVQTTTDGQGVKTLTFGVSGHANAVKDLYFLAPGGWIGSFSSDDAMWQFTMDMTGEYQFWAVDEANQSSNIITMSNVGQTALKPVADLRIDGATPLSAGGTASVAFSAPENALTYSLQVIGVTAEGQRCLLLSTNGAYEAVNGASFYVPFSAVSVTCRVEAFADGYTSSSASASGDVTGTKSGYRLPASLRTIEEEAFSGVAAKLIVVPEGCETIGANAFAGSAVSEVFLPGSVSSVASNAFPEATHIFRVYEGADDTIDWTLE